MGQGFRINFRCWETLSYTPCAMMSRFPVHCFCTKCAFIFLSFSASLVTTYSALRPRDGFSHPHQEHMKDTYNQCWPMASNQTNKTHSLQVWVPGGADLAEPSADPARGQPADPAAHRRAGGLHGHPARTQPAGHRPSLLPRHQVRGFSFFNGQFHICQSWSFITVHGQF